MLHGLLYHLNKREGRFSFILNGWSGALLTKETNVKTSVLIDDDAMMLPGDVRDVHFKTESSVRVSKGTRFGVHDRQGELIGIGVVTRNGS